MTQGIQQRQSGLAQPSVFDAPVTLRIASDFDRPADDFGSFVVGVTDEHSFRELPDDFSGAFVWFTNPSATATVSVAVSKRQDAEVDVAAGDGEDTKVGTLIPPRMMVRLKFPRWAAADTAYLIHEGTEPVDLTVQKGS